MWHVREDRALGVEPDLGVGVVGGAGVADELDGTDGLVRRLDGFDADIAQRPDAGVAARTDDRHRDPAAFGKQFGLRGHNAGELDHPAEPVLAAGHERPLGRGAGKRDAAGVADEVGGLRRAARTLVDEADRRQAIGVDRAFAGLHQQGDAGDARLEHQAIAVAAGLPADLAVAAQEATPHLVVQRRRRRQLGPVDRRGLVADAGKRDRCARTVARDCRAGARQSAFRWE